MLIVCLVDNVCLSLPYDWSCGEGCCSSVEYNYAYLRRGDIVELPDDYDADRLPWGTHALPEFTPPIDPTFVAKEGELVPYAR